MPNLEDLKLTFTWKQLVKILSLVALVIGAYYRMLGDIKEAALLPEPTIERMEFDMRIEVMSTEIEFLKAENARQEGEIVTLREHVHELETQ